MISDDVSFISIVIDPHKQWDTQIYLVFYYNDILKMAPSYHKMAFLFSEWQGQFASKRLWKMSSESVRK